jgi:prepilin-type N-terminal cleavage/methylation domain-containing protein
MQSRRRRSAFTLVEMLVAMALIVFIMSILSEAFVTGLKTFRDLKAVGDMDQHLRTVTMLLRDDLSQDHFTGKLRLSDPNFWNYAPPREGYFRITQRSSLVSPIAATGIPAAGGYFLEGTDGDGVGSYVASDQVLDFTVKRRGNQKDKFFSISPTNGLPFGPLLTQVTNFDTELGTADARLQSANGNYSTQWGQVAYFLAAPTPQDGTLGTQGGAPIGTPLFSLFRLELGVVPDNSNVNWQNPPPAGPQPQGLIPAGMSPTWTGILPYQGMSCFPGQDAAGNTTVYFNNPTDLASPSTLANRCFDPTNPAVQPKTGLGQPAVLLMTNVISFNVQVLRSDFALDYTDIVPGPFQVNSTGKQPQIPAYVFPYPTGTVPYSFDTSVPAVAPATNYTISALKISIRVWDEKTLQARQITIIQDM